MCMCVCVCARERARVSVSVDLSNWNFSTHENAKLVKTQRRQWQQQEHLFNHTTHSVGKNAQCNTHSTDVLKREKKPKQGLTVPCTTNRNKRATEYRINGYTKQSKHMKKKKKKKKNVCARMCVPSFFSDSSSSTNARHNQQNNRFKVTKPSKGKRTFRIVVPLTWSFISALSLSTSSSDQLFIFLFEIKEDKKRRKYEIEMLTLINRTSSFSFIKLCPIGHRSCIL